MAQTPLEDPEMNAILGLAPPDPAIASSRPNNSGFATPIRQPRGPIVSYSRAELLRLSKRTEVPDGLLPLESWFGQMPKPMVDDPAIAAISPRGMRSGPQSGFGEGFGFGGGIGGGRLGSGRGGVRNIGLRRQPEGAPADPAIAEHGGRFGGQMGKFAVQPRRFDDKRGGGERMGGDRHHGGHHHQHGQHGQHGSHNNQRRDDDWRRGGELAAYSVVGPKADRPDRPQQRNGDSRRTGGPRYDDDSAEPAWMNDGPELEDPAIASATQDSDHLVKFVPGEDMIAAHKRAMKGGGGGRSGGSEGDSWRPNEKPLVSFFGGEQPAATKTPPKPKEVNVANYFKHKVFDDDKDKDDEQEEKEETSAFQSRFQRFFGSGAQNPSTVAAGISPGRSPVAPESPVGAPRVDDHMAKLMGMLSTKGTSPAPRPGSADLQQQQRAPFGGFRGAPPPPPGMYAQSPSEPPHVPHSQSPSDYLRRGDDIPPPQQQYSSPPPPDPRYYGNFRSPMGELPQQGPPPHGPPQGHHQQRSFYDGPQRQQMGPPPGNGNPGPDLLSLLNQHGGGPQGHPSGPGGPPMPPPGMGMLPPHPMMQSLYSGGPPQTRGPGPSPDDLLRNLQAGGPLNGPPGFMRPPNGLSPPPGPQTPGGGPGGHGAHGGPGGHGGHGGPAGPPGYPMGFLPPQPQGFYGHGAGHGGHTRPPNPMYAQSPPPQPQSHQQMYGQNQHSQDMLAALMRH